MGKGGLNRLLLSEADKASADTGSPSYILNKADKTSEDSREACYILKNDDKRAMHIRTILARTSTFPLRVAVEGSFLHDDAMACVRDDGTVLVTVPSDGRRSAPPPPAVGLIVAMQRPKVIARVLEAAAALGVAAICVVAADKVEKSYWDCKLFRSPDYVHPSNIPTPSPTAEVILLSEANADTESTTEVGRPLSADEELRDQRKILRTEGAMETKSSTSNLPGRPRGINNHPHLNKSETGALFPRRVDHLPAVRRRLNDAVQQASMDAAVPTVLLERRGLSAVLDPAHAFWNNVRATGSRVVAHPYHVANARFDAVTRVVASGSHGAVLAIGPEGGWTDEEVDLLVGEDFAVAGMGERVLRSETAVVVGLGLVHEGLRLRDAT